MFQYDYIKDHMDNTYYTEEYSEERKKIHCEIISKHFVNKNPCKNKQIIFTGGCYGSGKTTIMSALDKLKKINLDDYVYVDQDTIRESIPEYENYLKECNMTAGLKTNKESGYIAELIQKHAMFGGYNLIIDSSLRQGTHLVKYINWIKLMFPHYKITIIFAKASLETIIERNNQRALCGKRSAETRVIEEVYHQSQNSLIMLTPLVDKTFVIDTEQQMTAEIYL